MRIESLELFLSVAEHGSVSRTAKQHFISQQGVSSALKVLEKELGTPLFTRGGPKLELTERGRAIASEAQRIVDSHRRMLAIASAPKDATTQNLRTVEILTTPFASAALEELFLDYETTTPGTRPVPHCRRFRRGIPIGTSHDAARTPPTRNHLLHAGHGQND